MSAHSIPTRSGGDSCSHRIVAHARVVDYVDSALFFSLCVCERACVVVILLRLRSLGVAVDAYMEQIIAWVEASSLHVGKVTTFELRDVPKAHALIQSGKSVGKIVLHPP